jgi:hypothetical protein
MTPADRAPTKESMPHPAAAAAVIEGLGGVHKPLIHGDTNERE